MNQRCRAIKNQFDLLYEAVEDTQTPQPFGKLGEGEILCWCHEAETAKSVADAMNIAERAAKAERILAELEDQPAWDDRWGDTAKEALAALRGVPR